MKTIVRSVRRFINRMRGVPLVLAVIALALGACASPGGDEFTDAPAEPFPGWTFSHEISARGYGECMSLHTTRPADLLLQCGEGSPDLVERCEDIGNVPAFAWTRDGSHFAPGSWAFLVASTCEGE
jgi:hypothetical protein